MDGLFPRRPRRPRRLFEKFAPADFSVTKRFGGTGQGLALSKALAGMRSGAIGTGNGVDGGAEFWFEVPFHRTASEHVPAVQPLAAVSSLEGLRDAARTRMRVLLVEDTAVNARVGAALLNRAGESAGVHTPIISLGGVLGAGPRRPGKSGGSPRPKPPRGQAASPFSRKLNALS